MKKRTKSNILSLACGALAVILLLGATGRPVLPSTPVPEDPTDEPAICLHENVVGGGIVDAGTATERMETICTACGASVYYVTHSNFKDNFPTYTTQTVIETAEDGTSTEKTVNVPLYGGNWSVGYMNATTFVPYNSFYSGSSSWISHDSGASKGLFRISGNGNAYWEWMSFGLDWDGTQESTPLAINYQVPQEGTVSLSATNFYFRNTADVYEVNILLNGNPLLNDWVLIASDANGGINDLDSLNALLASKGLDGVHVRFGDEISFVARSVNGQSVAQSSILPAVTYVAYDVEIGPCDGNAHVYSDDICRICGFEKAVDPA